MATTSRGIIYPTSSDNIAPLETHFANLANSANTAIGAVSTGGVTINTGRFSFTGPSTVGTWSTAQSVTFSTTFAAIPAVATSIQASANTNAYAIEIIGTPTTSGFTFRVYKIAGAATAETIVLHYMAK